MQNFQGLAEIQCFLLDMDGTFYLGDQLLPGANSFLQLLDQRGTSYLFLTNNSSKSAKEYADKLLRLGLQVTEDKIFTSGEATCIYLRKTIPDANVYLMGTKALEDEFLRQGIRLNRGKADVAVLGFDTGLTYAKLWKFCDLVRTGIPYIATHADFNCPTENGFMPDVGSMIALITASTGRQPDVVIGKPNQPIVDTIAEKIGLPLGKIAMVGDRLYTDIALGQTGIKTVLVLSGETNLEEAQKSEFQADWVVQDIAEFGRVISKLTTAAENPAIS